MGKLDLTKGQPAYLVDKSNKRKKLHESDQGDTASGHLEKVKKPKKPKKSEIPMVQNKPWVVLNHQALANPSTSAIQIISVPPPAIDTTAMAGSSNGPGTLFSTEPLRPAKKAKVSASSFADSTCPLCGGPKHQLRDCLVPKGGIEK